MLGKLTDADRTYLELTAKHAPHELGTEAMAKSILLLLAENEQLTLDAQSVEALEDQITNLEVENNDIYEEIESLRRDNEELEEEIQELKGTLESL